MSGIVAVVRFDGGPLDQSLVAALVERIEDRGPDGTGSWTGDGAALAHTLLATSAERRIERQPVEIGGIVAVLDGRIDARDDLARALGVSEATPESELFARAVLAWGDDAPARIIGDFAFVVWNRAERRLFAARDRFGVRPLYFAHVEGALVITNDLATLLATGDLAATLDDSAIADFLLFAQGLDLSTTTFARIGRIPPAHFAVFDEHGMRQQRYWSVPVTDAPRAISEDDAVEEFRAVLSRAVADRARADRVALSLSGGVDSTAIAAMLAEVKPGAASAVTAGYEQLIKDDDPRYAARAAESLGIPLHFFASDRYTLFERWDDPRCRGLEPVDTPLRAAFVDFFQLLGDRGRVVMTGQGGDSVLYASHRYFVDLLRRGRIIRAAHEAIGYALTRHRLPPLLFRSHALRTLHLASDEPRFPAWIRPELEQRLGLRERWREAWAWRLLKLHPWRPEAAYFAQQALWPNAFQSYDFAWTGVRAEVTVPFFDARVVAFLFSLPPMPHFADKDIVRRAMAGRLPDEVRLRPKTPLGADPVVVLLQRDAERWIPRLSHSAMATYVDTGILTQTVKSAIARQGPMHQEVAAFALAMWMTYR